MERSADERCTGVTRAQAATWGWHTLPRVPLCERPGICRVRKVAAETHWML